MKVDWLIRVISWGILLVLILVPGKDTFSAYFIKENCQPLFDLQKEDGGGVELNGLGPFITIKKTTSKKEYTLRPLFSWESRKRNNWKRLDFFYPLGKYETDDQHKIFRFIPFFSLKKERGCGAKENSFNFFPLFWGKTGKGEKYGGLFPLYGTLKERFEKDRIHFFLWPLYNDFREEDSTTYNLIWPIFSYTRGGTRSGYRIWPLYGQEKDRQHYRKHYTLWPFIHWQKRDLDTENTSRFFAVLPFYLSDISPQRNTISILWPFFNHTTDKRGNYEQWDFPWPFIQKVTGKGIEKFRFFPISGYTRRAKDDSSFLFWPIYEVKKEVLEDCEKKTYRTLIINKYETRIFPDEDRTAKAIECWPFFCFQKKKTGEANFCFPYLIPFKDEGFERNYAPIFRIYSYFRNPEGKTTSRSFWGFYTHQRTKTGSSIDVSSLISCRKEKNFYRFSLLKGMLEYKKEKKGKSISFFYLPWAFHWEKGDNPGENGE